MFASRRKYIGTENGLQLEAKISKFVNIRWLLKAYVLEARAASLKYLIGTQSMPKHSPSFLSRCL